MLNENDLHLVKWMIHVRKVIKWKTTAHLFTFAATQAFWTLVKKKQNKKVKEKDFVFKWTKVKLSCFLIKSFSVLWFWKVAY